MKTSYSDNNDTSTSTDSEKALKPKTREVGDKVTNATTDPKILVVIVVLAAHRLYATVKIKGDISIMVH